MENIEANEMHSVSTESQVTDDPALKDSNSGNTTAESSQSSEESKFVKKESRHVLFLRVVVISVLFAATTAISLVVYLVTAAGEHASFESQYYAAANKITGKPTPTNG